MKNFPRSQIFFLAIFLFLLLSLPVVLFLTTQRRHDIRPRAEITGAANLLLYPSTVTLSAGDVFDVVVKTQLTNGNLRVSGADFKVLYNKNLLEAVNVAPAVGGDKQPFTDVLINKKNESYDGQFNYLRVSEIAKKDDDKLHGGFVQLAAVKFKAKNSGNAAIKFPDNSELQIVGIDLGGPYPTSITAVPSTPTPQTTTPTPTITPGGPTLTPTPTITPGGPTLTPTPTSGAATPTPTPTSIQPTSTPTPRPPTSTPTPVDANCATACQAQSLPGGTCKRNQDDPNFVCIGDRLSFGCRWSPNYYCCCQKASCENACQQLGHSGGDCKGTFGDPRVQCDAGETNIGGFTCPEFSGKTCCCSGDGGDPSGCVQYCQANFLQGGECKNQSDIGAGDLCSGGAKLGCGGRQCCCKKPTCLSACQQLSYTNGACMSSWDPSRTCQGKVIGQANCNEFEYCCCTN